MIKRNLEIVQGDDYAAADSRALVFTGAGENWTDLSAATFAFKVSKVDEEGLIFSATPTRSVVSGVQYLTVPLTSAQTAQLAAGVSAYEYVLQATVSSRRMTLATGLITSIGDVT